MISWNSKIDRYQTSNCLKSLNSNSTIRFKLCLSSFFLVTLHLRVCTLVYWYRKKMITSIPSCKSKISKKQDIFSHLDFRLWSLPLLELCIFSGFSIFSIKQFNRPIGTLLDHIGATKSILCSEWIFDPGLYQLHSPGRFWRLIMWHRRKLLYWIGW